MSGRLPTHIEISGFIRAVGSAGGFATVLAKGEPDSGTILVVCRDSSGFSRAFERMPNPDGTRVWTLVKSEDIEKQGDFQEYLNRRQRQDSDLWILELDIADAERFIR
jgi:hypothetical protein